MNFCSHCGHAINKQIPEGDTRERHVCANCQTIHYQNPKIICGSLAVWENKVLLCRRAIEPRHGYWTLPAGFMENDESTLEAAAREAREEACAQVRIGELYSMFNIVPINQVYMMFLADLHEGQFGTGEESLECQLFAEEEIPWDKIAFKAIHQTLKNYFHDKQHNHFKFRMHTFHSNGDFSTH